ncbi:MAG: Ca-activated chloride channel family protein [Yoonia sp.]|jgi:hypothetical protein
MGDDLNHLKSLMDNAIPKPDAARRAANLTQAQGNFTALQQAHIATGVGLWQRVTTWLQSGVGKGAVTASLVLVAAGLFFAAPPELSQLTAPMATATKIGESAQERLVADFAAPAPIIESDDAPVASRATALSDQSAAPSTSYEMIRATLSQGVLPAKDDLRIAEMVNAFTYDSDSAETDANFATAITRFGQLLHDPQALGASGYDDVIALAQANLGPDVSGQRAEAVALMQLAKDLSQ